MQQRLARSRVSHFNRIAGLDRGSRCEVIGDQGFDRLDTDVGRDIAWLKRAQDLMNQQAVANLDGDLRQMLVAAMHRVARLEGGDGGPALLQEHGTGFRRAIIKAPVGLREMPLGQHHDPAANIDLPLLQHFYCPGMGRVGRAVDVGALELFVDLVLFANSDHPKDVAAAAVDQRGLLPLANRAGDILVRREGNRDRPEDAARKLHIGATAAPVGLAHEPVQGRVGTHSEHEEI